MEEIRFPDIIKQGLNELENLISTYPKNIPLKEAADYLGIDTASLRAALKNNTCPFGFGWQKSENGYWGFTIQAIPFYLFCVNHRGKER